MKRFFLQALSALLGILSSLTVFAANSSLPYTIDVGETGFENKRPTFAAACPHACPWGELGDFVKTALEPFGYEVILCRNCNRDLGPRLVSTGAMPPALDEGHRRHGSEYRFDAKIDFGVTASDFLTNAYLGKGMYARSGPYENLRLIAKIEDPLYLLAAVKKELGITDLAQIKEKKLGVRILGAATATPILKYYGLERETIESYGGSFGNSMGATADAEFDIIIDEFGSNAMNPEASQWTALSQANDLYYFQLPDDLLDQITEEAAFEWHRVTVKWGFLRGVDRLIHTIARSGNSVFARDDTPEQAAYDIAKAIDQARGELMWYARLYHIDPRTVWKNDNVPLHPGAARYYREAGYMD